ncbi:MAG TPA: hypothetical protein VN697_04580 [Tepidiformaceae bacterium]|nr:hypothetical protein [Tepidiformaceae bacterium]
MNARHAPAASQLALPLDGAATSLAQCVGSPDALRAVLTRLLDLSGLDYDQRVELLGGALVAEAVRPYWISGHSPRAAHDLLRRHDGELADVVETLSPVLLARAEARDEAREAINRLEALLAAAR